MRRFACGFLIVIVGMGITHCGYRVAGGGSGRSLTSVKSIGIPVFKNLVPQQAVELRLTQALIREFSERSKLSVSSNSTNVDALLEGEITGLNAAPVGFSKEKFGSTYLVTLTLRIKMTNLKTDKLIFQNDNFVFRDEYIVNPNVSQFFSEENVSLDRMAKDFASSVVASVFENF